MSDSGISPAKAELEAWKARRRGSKMLIFAAHGECRLACLADQRDSDGQAALEACEVRVRLDRSNDCEKTEEDITEMGTIN